MPKIPRLTDDRTLRPTQTAAALGLIDDMDLLRLKSIARLHARGLPPDVDWEDLLQEALTRVIVGSRVQPEGVAIVAFLAGVMRSLKSAHWRRALRRHGHREPLQLETTSEDTPAVDLPDSAPSPERALSAEQELAAIEDLFSDDTVALRIVAGLGEGLSAEQIRTANGLSETDYNSARRRIRRKLLKAGLTCQPDRPG